MTRILDAIQALVAIGMSLAVGKAAFLTLLVGLHTGAFSVVAAGSVGFLIGWLLFKWGHALASDLLQPYSAEAE